MSQIRIASLVLIALATGGWMLADGLRVLRTGRYFGPGTPGPWRHVPQAMGIDPLALGPVFVTLGALWLVLAALVTTALLPARVLALPAVLSLWYLPVGTLLSVGVLVILSLAGSTR